MGYLELAPGGNAPECREAENPEILNRKKKCILVLPL